MATLVCFHAHPDDESIVTAGTMAAAAEQGHRVVLVVATRGEQGEPVPGVLAEGEQLWERRVVETHESAGILGVSRVEFLGYEDSGMMGEPANENPACFWQADVEAAAGRLAEILEEESAAALTIYDSNGGYGHPDHIQVHRVGTRAAEMAGVADVFQATMNRDHMLGLVADLPPEMRGDFEEVDPEGFGWPEELITHAVDVTAHLDLKRSSMAAHASQIPPDDFFLALPPEAFRAAFGTEWFVRSGGSRPTGDPFGESLL